MTLLPTFGAEVCQVLKNPEALKRFSGCTEERATIWILTGESAPEKHCDMPNHLTVILPYGSDPEYLSWGFLQGHEPVMVWCDSTDYGLVDALWTALKRDGVTSALFGNGEFETDYRTTEKKNARASRIPGELGAA